MRHKSREPHAFCERHARSLLALRGDSAKVENLAYRREHAARDSMPTLPDIDPLSYDVPD